VYADTEALQKNARAANEALTRSRNYVNGWLKHCDPATGLVPRNLKGNTFWNAQDSAADNYPFMVLTAFFTDRTLYNGRMLDILHSEIKHTSRLGACPATFDFKTQQFRENPVDVGNVIFGSAEYMKDGLLPLTEYLGKTEWSERMINILNDLHKLTEVVTDTEAKDKKYHYGISEVVEVNGDLLQVLSRVYWMTGDKQYLDWAIKIGDHYLLEDNHPADMTLLRLRDHGGEIVLGLCELYATVHFALPEKKKQYQKPLYRMLDRILEVGRNEHGLFYDAINPKEGTLSGIGVKGSPLDHLADTWGYILDGYYTVYMLDKHKPYREAVLKPMNNLQHYRNHDWEWGSCDGYADAVESAINLYRWEPIPSAADWIDSEIKVMFAKQKPDGVIEGWYGDGNFARTAVMYALWKTQGTYISDWRDDVLFSAERSGDTVTVMLTSAKSWQGKLYFDKPRHKLNLHLPIDWTRINQFPEWFAPDENDVFSVEIAGQESKQYKGSELHQGILVTLQGGETVLVTVKKTTRAKP
jgi:hypothetical protein